jgi:hypothetical protein
VLQRSIEGSGHKDVVGTYPVFTCRDWEQLHVDLDALDGELVSIVLVTDPFGDYDVDYLQRCFVDLAVPYKEHFVVDLRQTPYKFVHSHHRRNARKALASVVIDFPRTTPELVQDWRELYAMLIDRHAINGMAALPPAALSAQLYVPGLTVIRAVHDGVTVGLTLWYEWRGVAYYHLAAYSPQGYALRASFALFWHAIEHFAAAGLRWLSLGAAAGEQAREDDGLSRFKRGWATGTRTVFLCGRILHRAEYARLVRVRGFTSNVNYFPAYRAKGQ